MSYIGSFDYNDLNIDEKNHIDYFIKLSTSCLLFTNWPLILLNCNFKMNYSDFINIQIYLEEICLF